jgi:hypothetical protein
MKLFQKHFDEFFTIYDMFGNQIVLYNNFGEIRISTCEPVSAIWVQTETVNCYNDVPIVMERKTRNESAFLTSNGIIRKHSRTTDCSQKRILSTPSNKWRLVKVRNVTQVVNASQDFAAIQLLINNESKFNWSHNLEYLNNLDLWNQFEILSQHNEQKNIFLAHENAKPKQETLVEMEKALASTIMSKMKHFLMQALVLLFVILLIVLVWYKRAAIWHYIRLEQRELVAEVELGERQERRDQEVRVARLERRQNDSEVAKTNMHRVENESESLVQEEARVDIEETEQGHVKILMQNRGRFLKKEAGTC